MITPSKFDNEIFSLTRNHINSFINRVASIHNEKGKLLLEIGPQERSDVQSAFDKCTIETLDIVSDYNPNIVADITIYNPHIPESKYDIVTCLEILEHTVNPFSAIEELRRVTKDGGYILFSAPLNFRIHGPVPDCWRFTEFGWKVLLKDFDIIEIDALQTPDRSLFPVKYNILAKCNKNKKVNAQDMTFARIK